MFYATLLLGNLIWLIVKGGLEISWNIFIWILEAVISHYLPLFIRDEDSVVPKETEEKWQDL
jgi:hypothetical protein